MQGEALILPARGTGNRLLIDEAMARARLPMRWSCEVRRSSTALDLVAAGTGVALLPRSAAQSAEGRVLYRPITQPEIRRPVGLLSRVGQTDRPIVEALKESIRAAAATAFPA